MSELGVGDELLEGDGEFTRFGGIEDDVVNLNDKGEKTNEGDLARQRRSVEDVQAVHTLPIVVIKNYAARGGPYKEVLLGVLANWAASLAENQVSTTLPGIAVCGS
jgi:hypothetical protein